MYWGDAELDKIETAHIDGTGRKLLGTESGDPHYFSFLLHGGNMYITDWRIRHVSSFSCAAKALLYFDVQ